MSDTAIRVREINAKELGIGIAEVEDGATLKSLGADSLDAVVISVDIEDALDIPLDETAIEEGRTIAEVIALVEQALGERERAA